MNQFLNLDTEKLLNKIERIEVSSLDTFIDEYKLNNLIPYLWLDELIQLKQFTKSRIAQNFRGTNYIYEICNGSKQPSRNKLLEVLLYIKASLKEIQFTLKIFEYAPLYPKNQRDLYIIYAIENNYSILEVNNLLADKEFSSL